MDIRVVIAAHRGDLAVGVRQPVRVGSLLEDGLAIRDGLKVAHWFPPCHIDLVAAAWTCYSLSVAGRIPAGS
jgi:hypothetical protein